MPQVASWAIGAFGFLPLAFVVGVLMGAPIRALLGRRRFVEEHKGRVYFVWRDTKPWGAFVRAHVEPLLPPHVTSLPAGRAKPRQGPWRYFPARVGTPALFVVTSVGMRAVPLHARLARLMQHPPPRDELHAAVRRVLNDALTPVR